MPGDLDGQISRRVTGHIGILVIPAGPPRPPFSGIDCNVHLKTGQWPTEVPRTPARPRQHSQPQGHARRLRVRPRPHYILRWGAPRARANSEWSCHPPTTNRRVGRCGGSSCYSVSCALTPRRGYLLCVDASTRHPKLCRHLIFSFFLTWPSCRQAPSRLGGHWTIFVKRD